ncbi:Panacea domain-containing protein [Methyloligella sp. 2.7D]|uniref:Panacea domain-containing protein n=1 Tax=unclassified Methyloligella TaxID=2625955 RepID=UPI00157DE49C|nr:Panacea domain-containing protein [Methyloligella sp. GL2]QKP77104.1 SocA family protein [Methyloligella sp. GL2]
MAKPREKAPTVKLQPNVSKIVEAILHVVSEAETRRTSLTQYEIVKTLFLADKAHLNRYGRPITFDDYVAMRDGPVPSFAYDLLKRNQSAVKRAGNDIPWEQSERVAGERAHHYHSPARKPDESILSPSDLVALSDALASVKGLSFGQIRRLTHEDPAYLDAWEDDGERKQYPMSYGLLFEVPDFEKAERIEFLSKHNVPHR